MKPFRRDNDVSPDYQTVISACRALAHCGLVGLLTGALAGALIAAFLFTIATPASGLSAGSALTGGALYGVCFGAPIGLCSALFGAAIGGRYGQTSTGLIFGFVLFPLGAAVVVPAAVAGLLIGAIVDLQLDMPHAALPIFRPLGYSLRNSSLYDLGMPVRFLLAIALSAVGLPVVGAVVWLVYLGMGLLYQVTP